MSTRNTIFRILITILSLIILGACAKIPQARAAFESPSESVSESPIEQASKTPLQPINPTATASITATLLPSSTPIPTHTSIPSLTAKPSPTPIPEEYYIRGFYGHCQYYAISCESSSAADWATFFGVEIYESDIQFKLPISDNPEKGFVGNVNDPWGQTPPYSYGVYAGPIADVLKEEYNLPARAEKNFTLEEIKAELAADQPVIAWVIGNMVGGYPAEYTDANGETTIVAAYEHTVILTGYGADHIRYLNNGRFYEVPNEVFLNSWGVLGNMVVFYE
jgi:uncharacterized protein YvpB